MTSGILSANSVTRAEAVVVGASAGALDALSTILSGLPADFSAPIMIVVHLPPDKDSMLVDLLQTKCALPVREAEDKEPIRSGTVYLAPPDYHLLVEVDRRLSLSSEEPERFSRPSIDVLFETAADAYGPALVGVVLTGANDDGARGLRTILAAGGSGVVQSPETAYAADMPLAALKLCPQARKAPLREIASLLREVIVEK
jgi:two-component system chemotaxis response regulator CheB